MFGIPIGLLIRLGGAIALVLACWYAVSAYNARIYQKGVVATQAVWIPKYKAAEEGRERAVAANDHLKADVDRLTASYKVQTAAMDALAARQQLAAAAAKRLLVANAARGVIYDAEIARLLALSTAPPTGPLADAAEKILRDLAVERARRLHEPAAKPAAPL